MFSSLTFSLFIAEIPHLHGAWIYAGQQYQYHTIKMVDDKLDIWKEEGNKEGKLGNTVWLFGFPSFSSLSEQDLSPFFVSGILSMRDRWI